MLDKTKTHLRSVTFDISPPDSEGLIVCTVNARIGDGESAEDMGCEYQCTPEQVREVQRIGVFSMLDLAHGYVSNDTRWVVCSQCGDGHKVDWDAVITPEDACEGCGTVGSKTTEPMMVKIWRRVANPKTAPHQPKSDEP